jgi:hypothetical protein
MVGVPAEDVDRYRDLLTRAGAGVASCWTLVQPVTRPTPVEEVVRRLGGDPATLTQTELTANRSRADPDRRVIHIDQLGPAVLLFEMAGVEGTRPEVLRTLSDGARVHSASWRADGGGRFGYAVYGRLLTAFDPTGPHRRDGAWPDALDGDLAPLYAALEANGDWRAALLAIVERRTGVAIPSDWPDRPHRAVRVPPLRSDPDAPGRFAAADPDLDAMLRIAPDEVRRTALRCVVSALAAGFDLVEEGSITVVVDALKNGWPADELRAEALVPLRQRLYMEYRQGGDELPLTENPRWRRLQAVRAIAEAAGVTASTEALWHARQALGDRWPKMREQLWLIARGRLPGEPPATSR